MTNADAGPDASAPDPDRPPAADPGWYPDPWVAGSRRYWSGTQWTSLAFPDRTVGDRAGAAARAGETNPFAERSPAPPVAPPAPAWVAPTPAAAPPPAFEPAPVAPASTPTRWPLALVVGAVVVALALAGLVALRGSDTGAQGAAAPPSAAPSPPFSPTPTPPPTASARPGEVADLAQLGLRQSDVTAGVLVLPIDGGLQVRGETTLDLCDGDFPSEALRQARVQVAGIDAGGTIGLSTETVRYETPAAVEQAWSEIQQVAARCSSTAPDEQLGPAPDASWPAVDGVRRLAYDAIVTDAQGARTHSTVVYLSRGNILMGVYFPRPEGTQMSVDGRTTVPSIVAVFEERLRQLPPEGVAGGPESPGAVGPTA